MDTRLYVLTYKNVCIPFIDQYPEYHMLMCGNGGGNSWTGLRDNTEQSIAEENWYYSELTGHYWMWKNVKCDIVGTLHYHRFLLYNDEILRKEDVERILRDYDIIVPKKFATDLSIIQQWNKWHFKEDMLLVREVVKRKYPECEESFDHVMDTLGLYMCNLMICRKEIFDEYCAWLFPILMEVRKGTDFNKYPESKSKRIGGFSAERLLNVWLYYKKLNICEVELREYDWGAFDIR